MTTTNPNMIEEGLRAGLGVFRDWDDLLAPSSPEMFRSGAPVRVQINVRGDEIEITIQVEETQPPAWFSITVKRLAEFLLLEPNWDSYGGLKVSLKTVEKALEILLSMAENRVMPPFVVPTSQGGVQLEWHHSGIDLELEIPPTGAVSVYLRKPNGEEQAETGQEAIDLVKGYAPRQLS